MRMAWQESLTYRVERVVWTLIELGGMIPLFSLWYSLRLSGSISADQSTYLMSYYLLMAVLSRLTSTDYEEWLINDIKDGNISRDLVKPFKFYIYLLGNETSWRISALPYILPVLILVLSLVPPSRFVLLFPFLLIAYLQRFLISALISFSAFWIEQSNALIHLKWMLSGLFGGLWLPIHFFPGWFQDIARFLPFYTWGFLPAQVVLGKISLIDAIPGVVSAMVWIIVLGLLTRFFWSNSLKHYGSVAG